MALLLFAAPAWAQQGADLRISKQANPDPVEEGDLLAYSLEVRNRGDAPSGRFVVEDELPDDVEFVDAFANQGGECEPENNETEVQCEFTNLAAGESARITILVVPTGEGPITNDASVFFSTQSNDPEDTVSVTSDVQGERNRRQPFPSPFDPDGPRGPFPPFIPDVDDDGIPDVIDEEDEDEDDDLEDAENDLNALNDEGTDGEGTDGDDFDTDNLGEGDDGVSATAGEGGAEASTPGASASAGGDPDEQAPERSTRGDVVDEVPTSGPLPNTGGVPVAAGTGTSTWPATGSDGRGRAAASSSTTWTSSKRATPWSSRTAWASLTSTG